MNLFLISFTEKKMYLILFDVIPIVCSCTICKIYDVCLMKKGHKERNPTQHTHEKHLEPAFLIIAPKKIKSLVILLIHSSSKGMRFDENEKYLIKFLWNQLPFKYFITRWKTVDMASFTGYPSEVLKITKICFLRFQKSSSIPKSLWCFLS